MALALIISIVVAVVFVSLYIDERSNAAAYREEIQEQKKAIARSPSDHGMIDDQDLRKLTPELVTDIIKYYGYVPGEFDGFVAFMIQGERYFIRTDRLPYLALEKQYTIDPDKYELGLFRKAAAMLTDEIFIGKVSISEDGETLRFGADAYEPTYGHCRDALVCYLNIIHQMQNRLHEIYEELLNKKDNQKKLEAIGFRTGESKTGENKLLS